MGVNGDSGQWRNCKELLPGWWWALAFYNFISMETVLVVCGQKAGCILDRSGGHCRVKHLHTHYRVRSSTHLECYCGHYMVFGKPNQLLPHIKRLQKMEFTISGLRGFVLFPNTQLASVNSVRTMYHLGEMITTPEWNTSGSLASSHLCSEHRSIHRHHASSWDIHKFLLPSNSLQCND